MNTINPTEKTFTVGSTLEYQLEVNGLQRCVPLPILSLSRCLKFEKCFLYRHTHFFFTLSLSLSSWFSSGKEQPSRYLTVRRKIQIGKSKINSKTLSNGSNNTHKMTVIREFSLTFCQMWGWLLYSLSKSFGKLFIYKQKFLFYINLLQIFLKRIRQPVRHLLWEICAAMCIYCTDFL